MTARKWGNAEPQTPQQRDASDDIEALKQALIAKGVLTISEIDGASKKSKAATKPR